MKYSNLSDFEKSKILLSLEKILNSDKFFDIPMGSTLASTLYINFFNERRSNWSGIIDLFKYFRFRYIGLMGQKRNNNNSKEITSKKIFITLLSDRKEYTELIFPLLSHLSDKEYLIIGAKNDFKKLFEDSVEFISFEGLNYNFDEDWRNEYNRVSIKWHSNIFQFLRKYKIPFFLFGTLAYYLLIQSNRAYVNINLLNRYHPRLILTEYDRNHLSAPMILAARKIGIPTITLQHGVIHPSGYGYVPVLAEYMFCWGKQYLNMIVSKDVNPEKIIVTGNPRLNIITKYLDIEKLGTVSKDKDYVVTLGTSPINDEKRRLLVIEFCETIKRVNNYKCIKGVVRLHPSEKINFYKKFIKKYPEVQFSANSDYESTQILEISDIVVVSDSGFGNDAVLANKIVVIFTPYSSELGNGYTLNKIAGLPFTKNREELANEICKILSDKNYRDSILEKVNIYQHEFCEEFGKQAADKIYKTMLKILN